ncbi:MAG: efflux RND transporter periplasmic adaptor subunit [Acidobacteriota bacterium]|nr:efflux RND transporter periplasmic adaptor subunit [Acidobacteriota bacterium]
MNPSDQHLLPAGKEPKLLEPPHPHHISAGRIILILVLLAAVVVAVGLAGFLPRKNREAAAAAAASTEKNTLPKVTAAQVRRSLQDTEVALPGTLTALREASIFARAAGYVRRRYVDIGDHVRAGQLLAEIDAPELDQQVAQARAAVSQSQQQLGQTRAALVQAQSQRDLARVTSERYNNLLAKGAVARQDADTQQSNYKTADALVDAQEANIRASEENVRQSQANLERVIALQEYKSVKAPFAGVVTARNVDAGSLISATGAGQGASPMSTGGAQSSTGNEMFRVAQLTTIRTLVSVPQTNVAGIRIGMAATVVVNELPGRIFSGRVARTASSLDPNTRTMLVEVQVPNGDGKLLPGMYADIHFKTHRDVPPLLVPGDTLISTNSGQQVAVLTPAENGARRIHMQTIQTGRDYGTETEVTGGLQGDELLVVNPGDEVREGALVKAEAAPKK